MTQPAATPEEMALITKVVNENAEYMNGADRGQQWFGADAVRRIALAAIRKSSALAVICLENNECVAASMIIRNGEHLL